VTPRDLVLTPRGVRFGGRYFPCTIGRSGVRGDKREGDGATPRGSHAIIGMLYRPDRMQQPVKWAVPIRPGDLWSDAPEDDAYNQMVAAPYDHSHEALRRADRLYDLVLLTDWNWPDAEPYKGSAIFLHRWRRPGCPTEGCIALRADHLRAIAPRITLQTRLIVG